jgi:hypothetical protein
MSTLQFILPVAGEDVILLNLSNASPSEFRNPFNGSISTALSGSVSTSNLLRASYIPGNQKILVFM